MRAGGGGCGDCRATRRVVACVFFGIASAPLRLIWRGRDHAESTLGCLDAVASAAALALGLSFACRFSWPFIYIQLAGRDSSPGRAWSRLSSPCPALPWLTSFLVASQGPQLASLSGHDAEQCEDLWSMQGEGEERRGGGRRGCCLLISPFHRFRVVPFELQFVCGLCSGSG